MRVQRVMTYYEWRNHVATVLQKSGYELNKAAFFDYLDTHTDLLTSRLHIPGGLYQVRKYIFMQQGWRDLYEALI